MIYECECMGRGVIAAPSSACQGLERTGFGDGIRQCAVSREYEPRKRQRQGHA